VRMLEQDRQSTKNELGCMLVAAHLDRGQDPGFRRRDVIGPIFQGSGVPACQKTRGAGFRRIPLAGLPRGPVWRPRGLVVRLLGWQLPWPACRVRTPAEMGFQAGCRLPVPNPRRTRLGPGKYPAQPSTVPTPTNQPSSVARCAVGVRDSSDLLCMARKGASIRRGLAPAI